MHNRTHGMLNSSPTYNRINSLLSGEPISLPEEKGRLLSLATIMWLSSTLSTFSIVTNGKVNIPF